MSRYKLVSVIWQQYGFNIQIVRIPEDVISDKLALASTDTGLITKMSYQDFIFNECIVHVDRVFKFIAEAAQGDEEKGISLRNEIEGLIIGINPGFDPLQLVINKTGVIKRAIESAGDPMMSNSDWSKQVEDSNPYIVSEDDNDSLPTTADDILDIITSATGYSTGEDEDEEEVPKMNEDGTITKSWERPGLLIPVKVFSEQDIQEIFSDKNTFDQLKYYYTYIVSKCIPTHKHVLILADSMGITTKIGSVKVMWEIYTLCVEVNPFLAYEKIDFKSLRRRHRKQVKKVRSEAEAEREPSTEFADVTKEQLLSLADRMKTKIIGQDHAIDQLVDAIQVASCGLREPEQPIATYLLCGTTGTGKTLMSKILAEELCGSRDKLIRIDCSEYSQPYDIQKLIGSATGYVGYEEGGLLTNAVLANPFAVVLFDELEKASYRLYDILLQIMDDARLTDNKGNVADFSNIVILFTSNIGVNEAEGVKKTMGFGDNHILTEDRKEAALNSALKNKFRPEFLNRLDSVIKFRNLDKKNVLGIIDIMLAKVVGYLKDKDIDIKFNLAVKNAIFEKGFSKEYGARPLQRAINKEITQPLSRLMLVDKIKEGDSIIASWRKGKLVVKNKAVESKPKTKSIG